MGRIYLAFDQHFGVNVAVKEMLEQFANPSEKEAGVKHFHTEASILRTLKHPNFPQVFDYFQEESRYYLAMEWVEGRNLYQILETRSSPFTEEELIPIFQQLCEVIKYLHQKGVIFRDFKPQNIMLTPEGRAVLIDFGIAKIFKSNILTQTMLVSSGSPGFSPPEQYSAGKIDARSDIYSLGATLYYLLTGKIPPDSIDRLINQTQLPPIRDLNESVTPKMANLIERMMKLKTEDRFQDIDEVIQAFAKKSIETLSQTRPLSVSKDRLTNAGKAAGSGISLIQPTQCAVCKKTVKADSRFCTGCGASITSQISTAHERKGVNKIFAVILLAVAIVLCGIFVSSFVRSKKLHNELMDLFQLHTNKMECYFYSVPKEASLWIGHSKPRKTPCEYQVSANGFKGVVKVSKKGYWPIKEEINITTPNQRIGFFLMSQVERQFQIHPKDAKIKIKGEKKSAEISGDTLILKKGMPYIIAFTKKGYVPATAIFVAKNNMPPLIEKLKKLPNLKKRKKELKKKEEELKLQEQKLQEEQIRMEKARKNQFKKVQFHSSRHSKQPDIITKLMSRYPSVFTRSEKYYLVGRDLENQSNYPLARYCYEKSIHLSPNGKYAQKARTALLALGSKQIHHSQGGGFGALPTGH
ncbi:MAG: serine/threonine protein kinase [Firmicutes bacterium]|nr:serine/threonine protein kinase [Bacillota bacterium]